MGAGMRWKMLNTRIFDAMMCACVCAFFAVVERIRFYYSMIMCVFEWISVIMMLNTYTTSVAMPVTLNTNNNNDNKIVDGSREGKKSYEIIIIIITVECCRRALFYALGKKAETISFFLSLFFFSVLVCVFDMLKRGRENIKTHTSSTVRDYYAFINE